MRRFAKCKLYQKKTIRTELLKLIWLTRVANMNNIEYKILRSEKRAAFEKPVCTKIVQWVRSISIEGSMQHITVL